MQNEFSFPFEFSNILAQIKQLETSEWAMILLSPTIYWVLSTVFFLLSKMNITAVELHRLPTDQQFRTKNRISVAQVITNVAFQHCLQISAAIVLAILTRQSTNPSIESPALFILKVTLGILFLDTYQYWWHRAMHENKWLYRKFHSVHHRLTVPYAYGALYNHPAEGFLMDILGSAIPAALLDMHPWTATFFFCFSTIKTVDDHCGYAFPWDPLQLLFPNNAAYHDRHHWGKGQRYNYSQPFFTFWDSWMGTQFDESSQKKSVEDSNSKDDKNSVSDKSTVKQNVTPRKHIQRQNEETLAKKNSPKVSNRRIISKAV